MSKVTLYTQVGYPAWVQQEDKETRERFHKAKEGYVWRHYYCLDGKATERICNLILSQVGGE